ncbi:DUF805 domain-containing protein [Parasphingorhabdus litoris]|uniref:DUF805 domain-containing protein n=1 Tax=Parasphingorhabdus litoris TaxID=394733 RepID=A0ABP3K828_9SPHN|nr:DUF805 domain-containing protein [Parasphingorhabdus litoris]
MKWMFLPLKRYADFGGRSRRKEYWMFFLFQVIAITLITMFAIIFGNFSLDPADYLDASGTFDPSDGLPSGLGLFVGLFTIYALATFIPVLAVQVRRLHDTERSGWWVLLGIIPVINYIGFLVLIVFYCLEGTKGKNRFGEDPKKDENAHEVFD